MRRETGSAEKNVVNAAKRFVCAYRECVTGNMSSGVDIVTRDPQIAKVLTDAFSGLEDALEKRGEAGRGVSRNMAGMTDEEAREYVTAERSWGCLVAFACLSALALLSAGWMVWAVWANWKPGAQAPYSVCPFCGEVLDGSVEVLKCAGSEVRE